MRGAAVRGAASAEAMAKAHLRAGEADGSEIHLFEIGTTRGGREMRQGRDTEGDTEGVDDVMDVVRHSQKSLSFVSLRPTRRATLGESGTYMKTKRVARKGQLTFGTFICFETRKPASNFELAVHGDLLSA